MFYLTTVCHSHFHSTSKYVLYLYINSFFFDYVIYII